MKESPSNEGRLVEAELFLELFELFLGEGHLLSETSSTADSGGASLGQGLFQRTAGHEAGDEKHDQGHPQQRRNDEKDSADEIVSHTVGAPQTPRGRRGGVLRWRSPVDSMKIGGGEAGFDRGMARWTVRERNGHFRI